MIAKFESGPIVIYNENILYYLFNNSDTVHYLDDKIAFHRQLFHHYPIIEIYPNRFDGITKVAQQVDTSNNRVFIKYIYTNEAALGSDTGVLSYYYGKVPLLNDLYFFSKYDDIGPYGIRHTIFLYKHIGRTDDDLALEILDLLRNKVLVDVYQGETETEVLPPLDNYNDLKLESADGVKTSIPDISKKKVVLYYHWFSSCFPCKMARPLIDSITEHVDEVEVIGLNSIDDWEIITFQSKDDPFTTYVPYNSTSKEKFQLSPYFLISVKDSFVYRSYGWNDSLKNDLKMHIFLHN